MAVGLVDQGSRGGGGKIWQRGRPSGGGGSGGGGGGGGVGGGGGGGGVDGGGRRPVLTSCGLTSGAGRRRWTVNILASFGYYLASFLASVYLLVSQKETNIFGLLFVLQIKKTNTQI